MPDSLEPLEMPSVVRIEAQVDHTVNYASYQNHVPLVHGLRIVNEGETALHDVHVAIRCEPPFAEPLTLRFDLLAAGETRRIDGLDIRFSHRYLAGLNEAERGRVSFIVSSGAVKMGSDVSGNPAGATPSAAVSTALSPEASAVPADGQAPTASAEADSFAEIDGNVISAGTQVIEIARADYPVDVLAYDQWAGARALPELLAAFCLPNNPVVDRLIAHGGELLAQAGRGQTMNGYQSRNREDVWAQISAIYGAAGALHLHYSEPPASFGQDGQKIRTPDRIVSGGVATCLDSTMLIAACLEQAGLNPLVLVKKGHAWIGCWLVNTMLATPVFDDGQAMRKRVASGELLVFDTTLLTQRPLASLRLACERGQEHLQREEDFLYAVDIRRARMEQILPLPFRAEANDDAAVVEDAADAPPAIEPAPVLPALDAGLLDLDADKKAETPEGRLARWKAKLLDLTLRNRLINFKPTKLMLPLRVPNPGRVEDSLSDGKEWKFRPLPAILDEADPRDTAVARTRTGEDPLQAAAVGAMERHELLAMTDEKKLQAHLYEIYSAARLGLEEGGANTLYLALGFLRWAEDERAEKTLLAPILLVPVTLTRQSVRAGYSIRRHDDEAIVNPTLVQLLRERFQIALKGIDPLPSDGTGIDVARVWQVFRLAVNDIPRWEVIEDVYLGIFSFTKYLMWKDLHERGDQLRENRVVRHLIERPRDAIGADEDIAAREDMDERHPPQSLLTPLLADSSQLNAVSRAGAGHDFALEGPPGTGKSQTITNLIAHFLGQGKTVLFVSEKMAALDVVQRRLNAIGLGPFCLQLHSARARKSEVLAQLRAAMEVSNRFTADGWQREAARLQRLRDDLNELVRSLHRVYPNGLTVRDATDWAIRYRHWTPAPVTLADPDAHDRAALERLREAVRSMQSVAGELGRLTQHPLAQVRHAAWSNAWEESFLQACAALDAAAAREGETALAVDAVLKIGLAAPSRDLLAALDALCDVLLQTPRVPPEFAAASLDAQSRAAVQRLREHGERREGHWQTLSGLGFKPEVARADGERLAQDWSAATLAWWPKRWFAQRAFVARLAAYTVNAQPPAAGAIPAALAALRSLNEEDRALNALGDRAQAALGAAYQGAQTDWSALADYEEWGRRLEQAIGAVAAVGAVTTPDTVTAASGDPVAGALSTDNPLTEEGVAPTSSLQPRLRKLLAEHRAALAPNGALAARLVAYRDAWRDFGKHLQAVESLSACGPALAGEAHAGGFLSRVRAVLAAWHGARRSLRGWCRWQQLRAEALDAGLAGVVAALEKATVVPADLDAYAEYSYRVWWLKAITDREPVLRDFSSADHERKIREFREADERFQQLTQEYVIAVLAGKVPRLQAGQKPDPEIALVLREIAKQKAHLPVRRLVQGIPTLLPRLKPCLLMSPLSVAQYLDAAHSSFDLVVFDEASQILVWDAVGAIARGRQLVVVGDPKQLPPTSFFASNDSDDAGEGEAGLGATDAMEGPVRDLESILDECLGAGLPTLRLEWHYRSRHESLITFSNHRYYDGRLITFPSPVTHDRAVRVEMAGGIYDRGGSRTNRTEAEAVVKAVVAHFMDEERRRQTMGIVTFNQPQQRLIETLLDEELRRSPELELRIAEQGPERLFIKNLENVQGDERDLILFSIAYGKDAAGRMAMNFGPLNNEGGHRRLNVAITRARVGVTIFCSIRPEDIDVSRTRAAGVIDLKNYLEFAQRGTPALVEQSLPTGREPDSPFEREVIRALRDRGWIVHPQVGCSGYRIDLAVVHPDMPGKYLLGVECDGATYHSLPTARDRDRLRQVVLEGLGWNLHRIWSTDWWTDADREMEKLSAVLEAKLGPRPAAGVPVSPDAAGPGGF